MNKRAEQAIDRSVSHNEIVHITASEEIDAALEEACDGSVLTQNGAGLPMTEFWGKREDGEEWRVHTVVDA